MSLHPTLIQANIALYAGNRAEALRLLRQYEAERPATENPHRSLTLWLEAQAQTDDAMRVRLLEELAQTGDPNDEYAQLAREALQAEAAYQPDDTRGGRGWLWRSVGGVAVVIFLFIGGGIIFGGASDPVAPAVTPTVAPTSAAEAFAALPDRSEALVADSYTARYEAGILQIAGFEDDSGRVIGVDANTLRTPVPGARFFALDVVFECRSGVCDEPPQATIALRTDSGDELLPRENAHIAGADALGPIALGRSTRGWLVYELPTLSQVEAAVVRPAAAETDAEPIVIPLPVAGT